jgi:hypothetical protein
MSGLRERGSRRRLKGKEEDKGKKNERRLKEKTKEKKRKGEI